MRISCGFLVLAVCVTCIFAVTDVKPDSDPETTHIPVETTISHLETSTVSPVTISTATPSAPSTKTEEPTTTGKTDVPTTTVTIQPTTTEEPTSTTVAPVPKSPEMGDWSVSENNITCIRAQMAVQIEIQLGTRIVTHNLSPNATSDESSCNFELNTTVQYLILKDYDYVLKFTFARDNIQTYVQNITFAWSPVDIREVNGKYFAMHNQKSYSCKAEEKVKMENVTLTVSHVHLQAFGQQGNDGFYAAEDCDDDDTMSNIVPLAVAVVLAAMVIIILIGYLIGRRQTRQRGYQSV